MSEFGTDGLLGNVEYERDGRIAHIVLNRPEKLNAFNDAQVRALIQAFRRFDADEEAWVANLSGAGRAFSSGADVNERQLRPREEIRVLGGPEGRGAESTGALYKCVNWKPVIAAVHGYALGMALGFVLECDMAVATESTRMQITEVSRGLWGSMYWARLYARGGGAFADEVTFTGRYFTGGEAAAHGIITSATDEGKHINVAVELAEQVLTNPPLAVRAAVRARRYYMQQYEFAMPALREGFPLHLSDDFHESALAFAERRPPREYVGR